MANKDVDININVNGDDDLNKSLKDAEGLSKDLNKELGTVDKNLGTAGKAFKKLGSVGGKALKGLGSVGKKAFRAIGTAIKATGIGLLLGLLASLWEAMKQNQAVMDAFQTAVNAIGIVIQPVAEGLGELIEGLRNGSDKFDAFGRVIKNVMKIALKPLQFTFNSLKIGILGLQIAWEKLSAALSPKKKLDEGRVAELKDEIQAAKDRMKELGKETGDSFRAIKEDAGEAFQEMKDFGKGIIDGVKDAVVEVQNGAARAATEATKNMERLNLEQERLMLQYQNAAEIQRQIRDDESKTFEERIAANAELGRILEEQSQLEIATVNKKIEAQKAILAVNSSNIEAQNELYALNTQLLEIEERINGQRSEQLVNINALNREKKAAAEEEIARAQEVADEVAAIEEEAWLASIENDEQRRLAELEIEQENFEEDLERRLANEEITLQEMQALRDAYAEQHKLAIDETNKAIEASAKASAEARIAQEEAVRDAQIGGALSAASALLDAADAVFGETKAGAIARTIIATYESATSAFNALAGIPIVGPVLGGVAAAAAVVAGLANIAKIKSAEKPSGAGEAAMSKVKSANQNPMQEGGIIGGYPHSQGGTMVTAEYGERIIGARANRMFGPELNALNELGQGRGSNYPLLTEERVAEIAARVVGSVPVELVESKVTDKQREVSMRESAYIQGR